LWVSRCRLADTARVRGAFPLGSTSKPGSGRRYGRQRGPHTSRLAGRVQSQFRVDVRTEGHAAVIVVRGELDLASSPALEEQLEQLWGSETKLLVIDLRELEFMDSTGLSIIVNAHQRLAEDGRELSLVRGPQQVQRLLDLTGVAERLRLVDSPEELLDGG
jgi:anti-sigma B factor antagonist